VLSPDGRCLLHSTLTRRCTQFVGSNGWTCRDVHAFGARALTATAAALAYQQGTTRRALLAEAERAVLDSCLATEYAVAHAADLLSAGADTS
jgi:hypothetical protein